MHFHRSYKLGPTQTPIIIKGLIAIIVCLSVLGALIAPFFKTNFFAYLFGLSISGIKHYLYWQFITYNFLQPSYGLNISFIIELLFNVYLLWIIGTSVLERISQAQYAIFLILNSIFSAFIILLTMKLGYPQLVYSGPTISLYASMIAWMMLNPPDTRIFLFFAIPMKHYWLVLGLIGFNLFTSLSNGQIVSFFGYIATCIFSYFYSVIIWNKHSPFLSLNKMERSIIYTCGPIINKFKRK